MNIDLTPQDRHGAARARHGGRPSVAIDSGSGWKVPRQGCRVGVCECAGRIRGAERWYVPELAGSRGGRSGGSGPAARPRGGSEPVGSLGLGEARGVRSLPSVAGSDPRFRAYWWWCVQLRPRTERVRPGPHHTITVNTVSFHFCRSHALYPQKIQTPQSSHL